MDRITKKAGEEMYPQKIYASQLITIDDLMQFKKQLLDELLAALKFQQSPKRWIKSHEVRRMLKISPGTLQTLKTSGVIPYSKIGGVHFYDCEAIHRILEQGNVNSERI